MTIPAPARAPAPGRPAAPGRHRLSLRRDPVRLLFSKAPWAGAWYLFAYLFTGTALFAAAFTATVTAAALSVTLAGIPMLLAAAAVVRGCAATERARLRPVTDPVEGPRYHPVEGQRMMARLGTRWRDPAIWRDLAYLTGLYVPLLALDAVVLTVWATLLAGITLPAWYRYPKQNWTIGVSGGSGSAHGVQLGYFPNGPHGQGAWGVYVDTLPKAAVVAVVCLILFLLFNYVLVATARLHAAIARGLLRAQEDPLQDAKEVLRHPGPLHGFIENGPVVPPVRDDPDARSGAHQGAHRADPDRRRLPPTGA